MSEYRMSGPSEDRHRLLGENARLAVQKWEAATGYSLFVDEELPATDSGSRTFFGRLNASDSYRVVIKYCHSRRDGKHEAERLKEARDSNPEFAERHLTKAVVDPVLLEDGGVLLIQNLAGDGRRGFVPLSTSLSDDGELYRWARVCGSLASALLGEWNHDVRVPLDTDLKSLLKEMLGEHRWGSKGTIETWLRDHHPEALEPGRAWMDLQGERHSVRNPWHAIVVPAGEHTRSLLTWRGRVHGDWHPGNIITPSEASDAFHDFWLIDLVRFTRSACLTLDPAYLCLTIALSWLSGTSDEVVRGDLIDLLATPENANVRRLPSGLVDAINEIRDAGHRWLSGRGHKDDWSDLFLAALVAQGLVLATRTTLSPDLQDWCFRLACRALTALSAAEGTPVRPESAAGHRMVSTSEPSTTPAVGETGRPAARGRQRVGLPLIVVASVMALAAAAGVLVYLNRTPPSSPLDHIDYRVSVDTNLDTLTVSPQGHKLAGSYVTQTPPASLPAPPGRLASCTGRYAWAHASPVNAVDAEETVARVEFATTARPITIAGARLHSDADPAPSLSGYRLGCPGTGGNRMTHVIAVDLDTNDIEYFDSIDAESPVPQTLNVVVEPGTPETFVIIASTKRHYCKWRLEISIKDTVDHYLTIGPAGYAIGTASDNPGQEPFETTAPFTSTTYWFVEDRWQPAP